MDNENSILTETSESIRPVKKVVLKRKPIVKKPVAKKEPKVVMPKTDASEKALENVAFEEVKEPVAKPAEKPVEKLRAEAPKKKRGRKPKATNEEKNVETASLFDEEMSKEEPKLETVVEAKGSQEGPISEANGETTGEAPNEGTSDVSNEVAHEDSDQKEEDSLVPRHKFNKNQHNQKGKRGFDQSSKYQKQEQRNGQKKGLTMDEISIPEAEYQEHLNHRMLVSDLSQVPMGELKEKLAAMTGNSIDDYAEYKKQEVIVDIIRTFSQKEGVIYAVGTLEILSEGYGFLRSPLNSYLPGPEDVYVAPSIIKFLNLKTGDTIEGQIRNPKENERFFAISRIASINGDAPIVAKTRTSFDSLVPLYPDQRINLETERTDNDVSMRIINLFCPIGKGQRALITAPPRTGKTILLQQIANAITANHPEIKLMVLLVDERPEEVTDMRRNVKGEVIASTFDEQATRHVTVAEMVIEKAKRLVEHKHDVVILLDSITRLARAYNQTVPASGKILSGGVDSNALHKPKRFFGAARNIENGGSLTIIASALIETGSRMDEVIFEEFKGTGNSEIVLDRRMADHRLYPAINIKKSGTRREDLLLDKDEAARIWILRNAINGLEDLEMTEFLIDKMRKTKNNEAFLRSMNTGTVPAF